VPVRVGPVRTGSRSVSHALAPLPSASTEELTALLHAAPAQEELELAPQPRALSARPDLLVEQIAAFDAEHDTPAFEAPAPPDAVESEREFASILADIAAEPGSTFQPPASLFQDFSVRCRMRRLRIDGYDLTRFRREFALAVAGIDRTDENSADLLGMVRDMAEDVLAPFLILAKAAQAGAPCPDDEDLARAYGTSSIGRIRRLLDHFEKSGLIVIRTDYSGRRSIGIPLLGATTEPVLA